MLPTARLADLVWSAAAVRVEPRPLTSERESPATFLQHHRSIEAQLGGGGPRRLVAGMKKDVVVTNRLRERADRVAIYGWHQPDGDPIQPLYTGHVNWYVDYSHGIRPVRRVVLVNGVPRTYESILADSLRAPLLSDEGAIAIPRYEPSASSCGQASRGRRVGLEQLRSKLSTFALRGGNVTPIVRPLATLSPSR